MYVKWSFKRLLKIFEKEFVKFTTSKITVPNYFYEQYKIINISYKYQFNQLRLQFLDETIFNF